MKYVFCCISKAQCHVWTTPLDSEALEISVHFTDLFLSLFFFPLLMQYVPVKLHSMFMTVNHLCYFVIMSLCCFVPMRCYFPSTLPSLSGALTFCSNATCPKRSYLLSHEVSFPLSDFSGLIFLDGA